jgi:hypothetical protein
MMASLAGKPKGEFETSEQYAARRAGYQPGKRTYVFVLDPPFSDFHYDADSASMQVTVSAKKKGFEPAESWTIDTKQVLVSATKYLGGNAFGVKKLITSTVYDILGIAEDGSSAISC